MIVFFKGGPLGGETREMRKEDFTGRRLRVPSLMRPTIINYEDATATSTSFYVVEEYELEFGYRYGEPNGYDAVWINPNQRLLEENAALKDKIASLAKDSEALEALDSLRKYFR